MSKALINPEILRWARNRPGIDDNKIVEYHKDYFAWENGSKKPTFAQAKKLANKLRIPFGYLYLTNPPEKRVHITDLRTLGDQDLRDFSVDLEEVIADARRKQGWYSELLREANAEPLPFVNKYSLDSDAGEVAEDITKTCQISIEQRDKTIEPLRFFTEQLEKAGILVIRNGKVGFNTKRALCVEEFRGFALNDQYAPLVFVNARDYKTAQLFTMIHEAAHIWIGEEGVSNYTLNTLGNTNQVELLCNKIAAEVLVPKKSIEKLWREINKPLEESCEILRKEYNVSTVVIARRAKDLALVSEADFCNYYKKLLEIWKEHDKKHDSGGNFYNAFPVANSRTITNAVCDAVLSGRMLIRNGAMLLNTKPSNLMKYIDKRGDY